MSCPPMITFTNVVRPMKVASRRKSALFKLSEIFSGSSPDARSRFRFHRSPIGISARPRKNSAGSSSTVMMLW